MDTNNANTVAFEEDQFDLAAHKKAADSVAREKSRVKRIRRQIFVGKIFVAIAMLVIFLLIAWVLMTPNILVILW
jgi:hypothetical protein